MNAVQVTKSYGGYLAVSALHPTLKVYIGLLDLFDYLVIYSTESDEMIALIMRELKDISERGKQHCQASSHSKDAIS